MRVALATLAIAVALGGCDPREFDKLRDEASVISIRAPGGVRRTDFGTVLAGYRGRDENGEPASRLAIGGASSGVAVYDVWQEGELGLDEPRFDDCGGVDECGAGVDNLGGFPEWNVDDHMDRMCVVVSPDEQNTLIVICETREKLKQDISAPPEAGENANFDLAESIAGLRKDSGVGVALLGTPGADREEMPAIPGGDPTVIDEVGAIYTLPSGSTPVQIEGIADAAGVEDEGDRLGTAIAAGPLSDASSDTLVAVEADGADRVVAARLEPGSPQNVSSEILGCIDGVSSSEVSLAMGDVDGDGQSDVLIGEFEDERVRVVFGSDLDGSGCTDPGTQDDLATMEVTCPEDTRDVSCEVAHFGASVAAGDVDADGTDDLVVGAPFATVAGKDRAGAVFVLPGSESGPASEPADALVDSSPSADDELGEAVTTVHTWVGTDDVRAEPVGGLGGVDRVLVFLCSALEGDTPAVGVQCLP